MYTILSQLKFSGPECAISSFTVSMLYAKTCFHLKKSQWPSGNVQQSYDSVEEDSNTTDFSLSVYNSEWHEQAAFFHLLKDTCATAIGLSSGL